MNQVKPTNKQIKAFEQKVKDPNITYGEAMLNAGYSLDSSKDPKQNLYETRGYQQLVESYREKLKNEGLDDSLVAKKLKNLVNSHNEDIQIKALDRIVEGIGIGIKNKDIESVTNIQINYRTMDTVELNNKLDTLLQDIAQLRG